MISNLRAQIARYGLEGITTFVLSNLVIIASLASIYAWLLYRVTVIARKTPSTAPDSEMVVVLGMRLDRGKLTEGFRCRLERAVSLYTNGKAQKMLVLGGVSGQELVSESEHGRDYLVSRGVRPDHILTEGRSRNTLENLRNARDILARHGEGGFVMITSRYHLARSAAIARGLGMYPVLCAAEHTLRITPGMFFCLMLETYFVHWYSVGAAWSRWVGWKRGIARIS